MVAHSMELDELLFSSFFMDHGNNNELKEISSSFNDRIYFKETGSGNTFIIKRSISL